MNRLYFKTSFGSVKVIRTLCWRNLKTAFATIFLAQVSFNLINIHNEIKISDPTWSEWSEYTYCSKNCGGGFQSRRRECLHGNIGDEGCRGKAEQENDIQCNTQKCPDWATWNSWGECDSPCGGGSRTRYRFDNKGVQALIIYFKGIFKEYFL